MSDDESILPNQSMSQINSDERSRTDRSCALSENTSTSDKSRSVGLYLIAQQDPVCLVEMKKYLDKASLVFIFVVLY
jgi:hypothetical protein